MTVRRNLVVRLVRARPRLFIATATGIAVEWLLPAAVTSHSGTRFLIAWNAATLLYVVLAAVMMSRSSEHHMRHRAQLQDDGQLLILILVVVSGMASLAAIAGQLSVVKDMHGLLKTAHIALAGVTVVSSWAFIQVMFATVARHAVLSIDPAISRRSACDLRQHSRQSTPSPDFTHAHLCCGAKLIALCNSQRGATRRARLESAEDGA